MAVWRLCAAALAILAGSVMLASPAGQARPHPPAGPSWHAASGTTYGGGSFCALQYREPGQVSFDLRVDAGSTQPTMLVNVPRWAMPPGQPFRVQIDSDHGLPLTLSGDVSFVGLLAALTPPDLALFTGGTQSFTLTSPMRPGDAIQIQTATGADAIGEFNLCVRLHMAPIGE